MNIELIRTVAITTVIVCCFTASFFTFFRYKKRGYGKEALRYAGMPFVAGVITFMCVMVASAKKDNSSQEDSCYIVTSENYVLIDLSKSNCAELGIILGNSPISDYTDGFSFSYLDLNKNEVEKSPIEVTGVKAEKKNGWCTATVSVSAQTPPGLYYIRVLHKFIL